MVGVSSTPSSRRVFLDLVEMGLELGAARVDHMEDQVGFGDLLEGGSERVEQVGGQVPDEPDGIGQDDLPLLGEAQAPARWIERGEELVFGVYARPGHGVEQGALAGVGVAHDADLWQAAPGAARSP